MNDYMNDINEPVPPSEPAVTENTEYGSTNTYDSTPVPGAVRDKVYTSADVYEAGQLSYGTEESMLIELLKAILGAVVGAIPGVLLWVLVGKVGFVAAICGAVLAGGVVCGYTFMTKDNSLPQKYGVIICVAVIIISVYLATKIVWTWEMADQFQRYIVSTRKSLYETADAFGVNRSDADAILDETLMELFGFTKGTFGECFSNFGKVLDNLDMRGGYVTDVITSYIFAALGGGSLFMKSVKRGI